MFFIFDLAFRYRFCLANIYIVLIFDKVWKHKRIQENIFKIVITEIYLNFQKEHASISISIFLLVRDEQTQNEL